jgi:hypothetical protein
VVERDLAKVDVAGSTPVSRSRQFRRSQGGSVKNLRPACLTAFLLAIATVLLACGDNRSLQSVSVSPATATSSQAQFTATGIYNKMPTSVDITSSTTWCIGSTSGVCVGNVIAGATVTAGLAQCQAGFAGTVTVLAGQAGPTGNPDSGSQLKPFGTAQLTCP